MLRELKIRLSTAELASPVHAVYQMCVSMRHKKTPLLSPFTGRRWFTSVVWTFSEHVSRHFRCISCTCSTYRCAQIFRRRRNHLKFLGARGLIQSTINIEDPKIFGAVPGFVHPCVCMCFVFPCVANFKYLGTTKLINNCIE